MYKLKHVIPALEKYCQDQGESIEEREERLSAPSAPIRKALTKAGNPVLARNIRLVLSDLQIADEDFLPYLQGEV